MPKKIFRGLVKKTQHARMQRSCNTYEHQQEVTTRRWHRRSKCTEVWKLGWRVALFSTQKTRHLILNSIVSSYMRNPTKHHFGVAKRILTYIVGTLEFGIWYTSTSNLQLLGFTDSDWTGSVDNRKSISGSVFMLFVVAFTWIMKKQDVTALSTIVAEYIATTFTACQAS